MPEQAAALARLRVELITTQAELESLSSVWEELWRNSASSTPFQSPAWLIPWARLFAKQKLFTLCLYSPSGTIVGLLPLYRYEGNDGGADHGPRLMPLGISSSDYLDGVFAAGYEWACATAALEFLAERTDWGLSFHNCAMARLCSKLLHRQLYTAVCHQAKAALPWSCPSQ